LLSKSLERLASKLGLAPDLCSLKESTMKKIFLAVPCLLALAPMCIARPAHSASNALRAAQQADCSASNPANGEGKFTGQISGGPNGSIFDVTSGAQSVTIVYNNSVLVCVGGQPANVNALALGANVVVYGPIKKKGKAYQMTATKILVAGQPVGTMSSGDNFNNSAAGRGVQPVNNPGMNQPGSQAAGQDNWQAPSAGNIRGGGYAPAGNSPQGNSAIAGRDDWNSSTGNNTQGNNQQSGGYSQGGGYQQGGSISGQDSLNAGGNAKNGPGSQHGGGISCSALDFSMKSGGEGVTGKSVGRASASGITCKRAVDQLALQLFQDDRTNRRLGSVTLNWQNQLEVVLTNAEVSSIQFTSDTGDQQVVEITFAYQKAEVVHLPSNTRVTF
jgi:type VI protein secretion system component Hcp